MYICCLKCRKDVLLYLKVQKRCNFYENKNKNTFSTVKRLKCVSVLVVAYLSVCLCPGLYCSGLIVSLYV